ncbi:hypothetical protein ASG91_08585 [Phycicoccus sp. Soil802]|nr:hypothetical protein ASG91_08585 [Phycicoccus sp. Soil802]
MLSLLLGAAAVMALAGCNDPVQAALTGSASAPTVILSPCRADWHEWDRLEVLDTTTGATLWAIKATGAAAVDMSRVTYGEPPSGAEVVSDAAKIPTADTIQWVWTRQDSEPVRQSFTVKLVRDSKALETDDSLVELAKWEDC